MAKKIIAVLLAVVLAAGIAVTCFIVFAEKTLSVTAKNLELKSTEARGDYYELSHESAFKFDVETKTEYYDVSAEYEVKFGGSDNVMYFLVAKGGQESVYALSMSDLALNFLGGSVSGNVINVRTPANLPFSGEEFKHGNMMLKYVEDYSDAEQYTVYNGSTTVVQNGADIKAHNVANLESCYFTMTVNDVKNELTETVKLWVVRGANNVTLSVHRLKF